MRINNYINQIITRFEDNFKNIIIYCKEVEMMSNEPDYYNMNGLSPLEAYRKGLLSHEEYKGFLKGNIIKYVVRAEYKGTPLKDLEKAKDYLEHYMNLLNETDDTSSLYNQLAKEMSDK